MLKHSSHQPYLSAAVLLCAIIASPLAVAQCGCPSDGHGTPMLGGSGLGESFPVAPDMAADPAWQVYEFERDGVRYTQINDHSGRVRVAVGRIANTFWVLPIGSDADRASTASTKTMTGGSGKTIYRSNEVEIVLHRSAGNQDRWTIRQPDLSR